MVRATSTGFRILTNKGVPIKARVEAEVAVVRAKGGALLAVQAEPRARHALRAVKGIHWTPADGTKDRRPIRSLWHRGPTTE